jgi:ion channel POLLUX/CASTOR
MAVAGNSSSGTLSQERKYKYLSMALFASLCLVTFFTFLREKSSHHICSIPSTETGDAAAAAATTHPLISLFFSAIFLSICLWVARRSFLFWSKELQIYIETKNRQNKDEFSEMEYFLYRLDYLYSHDEKFKAAALFSAAICLIFIGGCLWWVSTDDSLIESFWAAWTFIADPGTHADNTGLMQRLVSLLMTLGGMVIFAMLIGIISEDIGSFVDNLREGKSRVIVSNHTLILGQGDMLIPIIEQIALANESAGGGSIVLLTQCPKLELEATINAADINLRGSGE